MTAADLSKYDLGEMIAQAEQAGACWMIDHARKFTNLTDLIDQSEPWQLAFMAEFYARKVLKTRWPDAEPYILKDASGAEFYAETVINGPWPEAEHVIILSPSTATYYSINCLKNRWPAAEQIIKQNKLSWNRYCRNFPDAARAA